MLRYFKAKLYIFLSAPFSSHILTMGNNAQGLREAIAPTLRHTRDTGSLDYNALGDAVT